ncbi:MAG: M56 family metallopeptidase [Acidobacteria bacterium]|nr:M56 family metallopeptidase [Acidobacteriota bacterium]
MTPFEWSASNYLLNAAWLAVVVVVAAIVSECLLRRAPAGYLHRVWVGAAVAVVLVPIWSLRPEPTPVPPPASRIVLPEVQPLIALPAAPEPARRSLGMGRGSARALLALCGAAVLWRLLVLLAGLRRVGLLRGTARADAPDSARLAARRLEQRFGLDRVEVRTAPGLCGPATIGALRPLIVLGEGFTQACSEDELNAVLGHEMAHIARRDYAANLTLELLLLTVAWHPAVWLLRQRLMQTREMACDELAASCLLSGGCSGAQHGEEPPPEGRGTGRLAPVEPAPLRPLASGRGRLRRRIGARARRLRRTQLERAPVPSARAGTRAVAPPAGGLRHDSCAS